MRKRINESLESAQNIIKTALTAIADEWKIVSKNFTLIDEHEIEVAVDLINSDIESLKSEDKDDIVDALSSDNDLDIFDDIYVKDNKIIADCFILNSKLTNEERQAIAYNKGNVTVKPVRETGRDLIEVIIDLTPDKKQESFFCRRTKKLEKVNKSGTSSLLDLANDIESDLGKDSNKCILTYDGDFLNCTLDVRKLSKKAIDTLKRAIGVTVRDDNEDIPVCEVFPVPAPEGETQTTSFIIRTYIGKKEDRPTQKHLKYSQTAQYVLDCFDKALKYYSELNNKE